jgi:hypothetical protein
MLLRILILIGFLPHKANASWLDSIGQGAGVQEMWGQIRGTFPWTDTGGQGAALLITKSSTVVLSLIASVGVISVIYGGIRLATSGGDESRYEEAKKIIMYASLGIILAGMAEAIILYAAALISRAVGG